MSIYSDNLIVSEFRSGKSIEKITSDLLATRKADGIKTNKYDCKQEVETAILNYVLSKNKNVG